MAFRISGLPRAPFEPYFRLSDAELLARGARRYVADGQRAFPCRVSMRDCNPGERVILLSYEHQAADSPYRASGPIFVRENADETSSPVDHVPDPLRARPLSVRAYDAAGLIVDAEVIPGSELEPLIGRLFERDDTAYLHVHHARYGCYHCRIDRA